MTKKNEKKKRARLLDPKQEAFLYYYTNPESPTFGNARQSGIKVGYSKEYSDTITAQMPDWLSDNLGDLVRLRKAEKNLSEVQGIPLRDEAGKIIDPALLNQRNRVDMFLAKALDKKKYAERTEVTGKDGKDLPSTTVNAIVSDILNG